MIAFKEKFLWVLFFALCTVGFAAGFTDSAWAQQSQASDDMPLIKHIPTKAEQLPPPGKPLKIWAALNKTRSIDMRIRAIVVLDGAVMDLPLSNPTYNDADDLVFSAEIPSPLERVSYQFFVNSANGEVQSSRKFFIERKCIPVVEPLDPTKTEPESPNKEEGIGPLIRQNEGLEREIDNLQSSILTLNKIKSLLKE